MDGKGLLVVVLAGLVAILSKSNWDHAAASGSAVASTAAALTVAAAPAEAAAAAARAPTGSSPAAVTALVASAGPAPARGAPKAAKPGAGTGTAPPAPAPCRPSDAVCQIEHDFPGAYDPPAASTTATTTARRPLDAPVRLVLASLPKPASTGFAAEFDRAIEAIERSVQSQRYVLQRHWFPWGAGTAAEDKGKPGWMLFRRDGDVSVELLLFGVVSESPGSGVDQDELQSALDVLQTIAGKAGTRASRSTLSLLGPYFSGAAVSLDQQLRRWCGRAPAGCGKLDLFAVSGSATRRQTQKILHGLAGVFASSEFHATVLPDDVLVAGMHRFLDERLEVSDGEAADLTEASTDYGNDVANAGGFKIPFPLQIGVLASDGKTDDGGVSPDQPKVFDKLAGKKIELELGNTFAALSRHSVRHVGILATSTRDKIFLARQFRQSAPNLRIHTYESSVDLADSELRQALEGLMVASSYPLFPDTQLWNARSNGALQQFPSMIGEGIYNAVLVLLSRFDDKLQGALPDRLLDYASNFCEPPIPGPSAWVSVSIAGQLWPLAVYPANVRRDAQAVLCQSAASDPYVFVAAATKASAVMRAGAPPSLLIILGLAIVVLLLAGNAAGLVTPLKPYSSWRLMLVTYDSEPHGNRRGWDLLREDSRRRIVVLGLWTLAIIALVMGKILRLPAHLPGVPNEPWIDAFAVVLIAGAFVPSGIAFAATVFLRPEKESKILVGAVQGVLLGLLALVAFTCPVDSLIRQRDGHAYFFFLRAMDPGVGLTPTIPLFTVGMTIYGACLMRLMVIRRANMLRAESLAWRPGAPPATPPPSPPVSESPQSFDSCAAAMGSFAREASKSLLPACAVGVAVGTLVLFLTPVRLGSFEGRMFDLGCSVCFSLVFTLTLAAAWRAQFLWTRLRDFTRALAIHPAAAALQRLPDSVAQRFRTPVPGQVGSQQIETGLKLKMHALGETTAPKIGDLLRALDRRWFPLRSVAIEAALVVEARPGIAAPAPAASAGEELREDILALHMANVLGLMCDATRTMLFIATGAGLAALFGYALYPFQPAAALTGAGLVSMGLVAIVALRVLLGIERDHVLSLVAQTTPGKITPSLGLAARLLGYVVVPLGTLIGSRLQAQGAVIEVFQNLVKALNR